MNTVTYQENAVIFREGDPGNSMFEVLTGSVSIYSDWGTEAQQLLSEIASGAMFGEMSVLESAPRSATAVASKQTELLEIAGDELQAYLTNRKDHVLKVMQGLSAHLRARTKDYADVRSAILEAEEKEKRKKQGVLKRLLYFFGIYERSQNSIPDYQLEEKPAPLVQSKDRRTQIYDKGDIVFHQGDTSREMLILRDGEVGIYESYGMPEQKLLTILQPGACFGEMGLIDGEPRSATAVAMDMGARLERVTAGELEDLMESSPELVMGILRHLSARLRQITLDYLEACKAAGTIAESVRKEREMDAEAQRLISMYASMSVYNNFY